MMKMHEIIRTRRRVLGLTQEAVAERLGVTAAAVNKWERGASCPDIALLPPLARLLCTDLNTLLSFRDDLTDGEIAEIARAVAETIEREGLSAGYAAARERLCEFPTCDRLLGALAIQLYGALEACAEEEERARLAPGIERLCERAARSGDAGMAELAQTMLIGRSIARGETEHAQQLLEQLPKPVGTMREQLEASLLIAQGRDDEAQEQMERRLLGAAGRMQNVLLQLLKFAHKRGDEAGAERYAALCAETARLFELGEYAAHVPAFQLAMLREDADGAFTALDRLLRALDTGENALDSPLYAHIPGGPSGQESRQRMARTMLDSLRTDPDAAFLRDDPRLDELLKRYEE